MTEEQIKVVLETNVFAESLVLKALELVGIDTSSVTQQEHPNTSEDTIWLEFTVTNVLWKQVKTQLDLLKPRAVKVLEPTQLPKLKDIELNNLAVRSISFAEINTAIDETNSSRVAVNPIFQSHNDPLSAERVAEILNAETHEELGIRGIGKGNLQTLKQVLVLILQTS